MKLKNKAIVILSYMRFDGLASTNFTIARYLSEENTVYYVDHPYTWRDYFFSDGSTDAFLCRKPFFSWFSNKVLTLEKLRIIIPTPVFPINWLPEGRLYRFLLKLNEKLVARKIKSVLKKDGISNYIFINSWDFHYPSVGKYLNADLQVYHCVDPLITPYDKKHGEISEKLLVEASDLIICTSRSLQREKKLLNEHTFFIPNAADLVLQTHKDDLKIASHPGLSGIGYPRIGYIGAVERRFDFDLLYKVLNQNSDLNFVFVGPVSRDVVPTWFLEQQNVYILPSVRYEEVPSYIAQFDVCIIPFKKDEVSDTIFPLKLFEYLGMGRPVISTDFNMDLQEFTGKAVKYSAGSDSFSALIREALLHGHADVEMRLQVASANTWQRRAEQFADLIHDYLRA
ncbi:glycosyltransferase [Olivibacter sp. XZL3]|uniref:glycosyltransferase n=1 Tax=Olivibacter sp. XZL3 TaxID=1735116 RepID=UPI001066FA0D|nr:glycosyltransferase [Olivibacter sp. XZL3]